MSSSFKIKNKKKSPVDTRITLDAQHNQKMKYFKDLKKSLPAKKKNLKSMNHEFKELKKKKFNTLSDEEIARYLELKEQIPIKQKEIENIETNKEETEYLLNTGYLLCQYYDNINHVASGKKIKRKKKVKKKNTNTKSVIDFFQRTSSPNNLENIEEEKDNQTIDDDNSEYMDDDKESTITDFSTPNDNIDNDPDSHPHSNLPPQPDPENDKHIISRAKILDEYLSKTDKRHIKSMNDDDDSYDICKRCHQDSVCLIHSDGILVCKNCGFQIPILIDSDKPSYKDPPREISYFAYKRINHFNELKNLGKIELLVNFYFISNLYWFNIKFVLNYIFLTTSFLQNISQRILINEC